MMILLCLLLFKTSLFLQFSLSRGNFIFSQWNAENADHGPTGILFNGECLDSHAAFLDNVSHSSDYRILFLPLSLMFPRKIFHFDSHMTDGH